MLQQKQQNQVLDRRLGQVEGVQAQLLSGQQRSEASLALILARLGGPPAETPQQLLTEDGYDAVGLAEDPSSANRARPY